VKVVVVNEGEPSAVSTIDGLNQLIKNTPATWILLVTRPSPMKIGQRAC